MLSFKIARKVTKYFGFFCEKICHQELSKIVQSGHIVQHDDEDDDDCLPPDREILRRCGRDQYCLHCITSYPRFESYLQRRTKHWMNLLHFCEKGITNNFRWRNLKCKIMLRTFLCHPSGSVWPDWVIYWTLGNSQSLWQQLIRPNLPHSLAIFVKVSKSIISLEK